MSNFPRGSEWRRWDLHVHTPDSIVQHYGGPASWDRFIEALATLPADIEAIAINDYLFVDGYEKVLARRNEIPNIKAIFPSVEFRLDVGSGADGNQKRLNFHVILEDGFPASTIRDQLLNLPTAYLIEDETPWHQTPTRQSLVELGAHMKRSAPEGHSIHEKSDLKVGFDSITYKHDDIMKNLGKDPFRGRYLTAIGYAEWNQMRWDQVAGVKRTLLNKSDFILTANDDAAAIDAHVATLWQAKLKSVVFHSSDAHSFDRLGKTQLWLRADPTFAGLRRSVGVPERVFIGSDRPREKSPHQVIESVSIPASSGWFAESLSVPLNDGLVAIIGSRGSGKSALAEMIAWAAGKRDDSPDSFVAKAANHLSPITGTRVKITWADDTDSECAVGGASTDGDLVRFLPQKAVEALCAPENNDQLVAQIENVIFQSLDPTQTLGCSDFVELKSGLLTRFDAEKAAISDAVHRLNAEEAALTSGIASAAAKKRDLLAKEAETKKLEQGLPKLPPEDEKAQKDLAALHFQKKRFEDRIVELRKLQEQVSQIEATIRMQEQRFTAFSESLSSALTSAGISETAPFAIAADWKAMYRALNQRRSELQAEIDTLRAGGRPAAAELLGEDDPTAWQFDNLNGLTKLVNEKSAQTKAFEVQKLRYQEQMRQIAALQVAMGSLRKELAAIDTELTPRRAVVRKERLARYAAYFSVLDGERTELSKLYEPLRATLARGSDTDRRLSFEAEIQPDIESHLRAGVALIDRTKRGSFRDIAVLRADLADAWRGVIRGGYSEAAIRDSMTALWKKFTRADPGGPEDEIDLESQLRDGVTRAQFAEWFFSLEHYSVKSALKFDGTDLYLLSPGQKGIVLLMLYLGMDAADHRPLIIDQPEDNLDNMSVVKDLISLFRTRKRQRQIILVTHNPNLVVNADADQVLVASFDGSERPRIRYSSGSLEDQAKLSTGVQPEDLPDGILESVCNILEGGRGAFHGRHRAYSLSPKI